MRGLNTLFDSYFSSVISLFSTFQFFLSSAGVSAWHTCSCSTYSPVNAHVFVPLPNSQILHSRRGLDMTRYTTGLQELNLAGSIEPLAALHPTSVEVRFLFGGFFGPCVIGSFRRISFIAAGLSQKRAADSAHDGHCQGAGQCRRCSNALRVTLPLTLFSITPSQTQQDFQRRHYHFLSLNWKNEKNEIREILGAGDMVETVSARKTQAWRCWSDCACRIQDAERVRGVSLAGDDAMVCLQVWASCRSVAFFLTFPAATATRTLPRWTRVC